MILDQARSRILRSTLRCNVLASCYANREQRTLLLFLFSIVFNALLILQFPEFAFYLGPLALGIPHLIASFRFSMPRSSDLKSKMRRLVWLGLGVTFIKLLEYFIESPLFYLPEALAVTGTILIITEKWTSAILCPLIMVAFYFEGIRIALVLMILHNYIAFLFWWMSAKTNGQKSTVLISGAFLTLVLVLFYFSPTENPILILKLFGNMESDRMRNFLLHSFLISQAAHYFIWLKAIPDFENKSALPLSFRATFTKIKSEVGKHTLKVMCTGTFVVAAIAFFIDLEEGRLFYLYLSSFHGLMEMGILFTGKSLRL